MNYDKLRSIVKYAAQKKSGVDKVIARLENKAGIKFSEDYKEYLRSMKDTRSYECLRDPDGYLSRQLYSLEGEKDPDRLKQIYSLAKRNDWSGSPDEPPIYAIGEDVGGNQFGYLKGSDDKQIYDLFHETNELSPLAENLTDFFKRQKNGTLGKGLKNSADADRMSENPYWKDVVLSKRWKDMKAEEHEFAMHPFRNMFKKRRQWDFP